MKQCSGYRDMEQVSCLNTVTESSALILFSTLLVVYLLHKEVICMNMRENFLWGGHCGKPV